jgi:hypothetical protein
VRTEEKTKQGIDLAQRSRVSLRGSDSLQLSHCEASRVDPRTLRRAAHSESEVDQSHETISRRSTHLLSSAREASLSVDGDEVDRTKVEAEVHVECAFGLRGRHAEASVVRREVAQLGSLFRIRKTCRI